MTETLMRTYQFRAFTPVEGIADFDAAVALKREMWAELCKMQEAHVTKREPLLAVPDAAKAYRAIRAAIYDTGHYLPAGIRAEFGAAAAVAAEELTRLAGERTAAIAETRRAYKDKGLAWGDYNAVVFQFDGARRASAARKALPSPADDALGDAVVRQIMNGAAPHHLLSRDDASVEYLPRNEREQTRVPGSRRHGQRRARLTFLIRTKRHPCGEARLTIDYVEDRPLPANAKIVEVRVLRRKLPRINKEGQVFHIDRWLVTFAMKVPKPRAGGSGAIGVAFDWRGDGMGGSNAAVVCDKSGVRTLGFGEEHIAAWERSRGLFEAAEAETDPAEKAARLAEAQIFRRRLVRQRKIQLREFAKNIVAGAAACGVEKSYLPGKGVKKFTAPGTLRLEIIRAAENAGCLVVLEKIHEPDSKKRAAALRKKAAAAVSGAMPEENTVADHGVIA